MTTIGELAKTGTIQILRAPPKARLGEGGVSALTLDDVARGQAASGKISQDADHVHVVAGDVVVSTVARHPQARVVTEEGPVLGPYLAVVRVDPGRHDPHFVAGWLRLAAQSARLRSSTASARFDVRRARLPRLPIDEQTGYGTAVRKLADLETSLHETREQTAKVLRQGLEGLGAGTLRPLG